MKKIIVTLAALVMAFSVAPASPTQAAPVVQATPSKAALPHWSPWVLCNTAGKDYHARILITPISGSWWPSGIQVKRAVSTARPPMYDFVWLDYSNSAGKIIADGGFSVSRRDFGANFALRPLEWAGTARPQFSITLIDSKANNVERCVTNRVAVG